MTGQKIYAISYRGWWLKDYDNRRLEWTAKLDERLLFDQAGAQTLIGIIKGGNPLKPVKIVAIALGGGR